jgi:hypothetical protein
MATLAATAAIIGTFPGGDVTIGGMASSDVTYSSDNNADGSWTTTLAPSGVSDPWYTRLEIGSGSFNGPVEITWQLQQKTTDWGDIGTAQTTNIVLSGNAENVYASSDGSNSTNYNWSTDISSAGTYRVVATVDST